MHLRAAVIASLLLAAGALPALAQFPPPGVYRCTTAAGVPFGILSLFAAGDYQFSVAAGPDFSQKAGDPGNGKGQVTSASTAVEAQSGPLATVYHWKGTFATDAHKQHTRFTFTGGDGTVVNCGTSG